MNENQPTQFGLYAGQWGFELAYASEGFRCAGISEIDPAANLVTAHWFGVENFGEVLAADFCDRVRAACGQIDVLTGGVPCTPASLLGKRLGVDDERWLWDRTIEVCGELRPRYAHFENPAAILTVNGGRAWNGIVCGLAEVGYDCWWERVPAVIFGAGHLRERLFLIAADTDSKRCEGQRLLQQSERKKDSQAGRGDQGSADSNPDRSGGTAWPGLREVEPGQRRGRPDDVPLPSPVANAGGTGLQGHPGHGEGGGEPGRVEAQAGGHAAEKDLQHATHSNSIGCESTGQECARQPLPPLQDMRGRVSSETWWHEANTGIPVLAHGLSSKLVEAACRLTGNAVVPQAIQPFARALYQMIQQQHEPA